MNFNKHLDLEGQHAFLSPSKHSWINYSDEKIYETYKNFLAVQRGTKRHEIAKSLIEERIKLPRNNSTLNHYVNDAISFRMTPEQPLYYSPYAFGTADAISFRNGQLRIHDLKTGATKASMDQLLIYAAFFCLEYGIKPSDIDILLQIYQNDQVIYMTPEVTDILPIMDRTVTATKIIERVNEEEQ